MFAFHAIQIVYVVDACRLTTVSAYAALGENVPARPPLSFHTTSVGDGNAPPLM